jgi:hypothetical protein
MAVIEAGIIAGGGQVVSDFIKGILPGPASQDPGHIQRQLRHAFETQTGIRTPKKKPTIVTSSLPGYLSPALRNYWTQYSAWLSGHFRPIGGGAPGVPPSESRNEWTGFSPVAFGQFIPWQSTGGNPSWRYLEQRADLSGQFLVR